MGYGTTAMILLFAVVFALYVGSDGDISPGFLSLWGVIGEGGSSFWDMLINSFLNPAILGSAAIVGIVSAIITRDMALTLSAASIAILSNVFLFPLASIRAAGLPMEITWLVIGFMNMLLIAGIMSFIRGKNF